jgi:hypothetical protein
MWKYDQRLLYTVDYAFVVLVLIASAGAIANFVNARRELALIRTQVQQQLDNSTQSLKNDAAEQLQKLREEYAKQTETITAMQRTSEERASNQRGEFQLLLENSSKRSEKNVQEAIKTASDQILNKVNRLKYETAGFLMEYHMKDRPLLALRACVDRLEARWDMGWFNYSGDDLKHLATLLERQTNLHDIDLTRLQALQSRVPEQFDIEKKRIGTLIEKSRQ